MAEDKTSETETFDEPAAKRLVEKPVDSAGSKEAESAHSIAEKKPKKRLGFGQLLTLLLLFALIALAGSGYWGWQWLQQELTSLNQQNQQLAQELESSSARIRQFESSTERTDDQWRSAVSNLEALVVESAQRWNAQSDRSENRWPLEEALTLARLAAQRLQLDADASIAVRMLQSADTILAQMDQAAVLPLRRQLANDILALESTQSADVNGLFFKLEAISERIRTLSWTPEPQTQSPLPENTDPASGFWHSLKNVVVITRLDVHMEAPALQTDFERWRQHTLMLLEQTQLALLAGNQSLFDTALQQSQAQIDVMRGQLELTAVVTSLADIQNVVLNPAWPDIDASINVIEAYLAGPDSDEASEQNDAAESPAEEGDA